ncbi:PQQ-binding-like beta-propeller repeat protein [Nocardia sp. NPDC058058]|uniref:outer membrane protein assembly factor BamB family protein n=1 Tax=Nocardia sp. NPDC058058 TaxID=3346317 RepID=UPI0036D90E56
MHTAAQWFTGPNRRRSWIAVLVVAVVVGVAAFVVADRSPKASQQATPVVGGKFRIEPVLDSAPAPRWTVRAADLSTDPGAVLLSVPHGLDVYYGNGTPMDAGTTIVAATGVPESAGAGAGRPVPAVRLHGIDPDTGKPRWSTDIGAIDTCAEEVFQGLLSCWGTHRVLIVDSATGAIRTDHTTDFEVQEVDARDGVVTVAGRTEDNQTAVFTRGTVSDTAANWRKTFPTVAPGQPVLPTLFPPDYFRYGRDGNEQLYDLRTGEPLFAGPVSYVFNGGVIASQVIDRSGTAGKVVLLGRDGHRITEVDNASFLLEWYPVATASPLPIMTGQSAYDRTTGAILWTNPDIGMYDTAGRKGAIEGVVRDSVIVRSLDGTVLSGLDLADGHRIWQRPSPFEHATRFTSYDGITDATHLILTDGVTVQAIDGVDGTALWSIPLPPSGDPRIRPQVRALGGRMVTTTAQDFTGYGA